MYGTDNFFLAAYLVVCGYVVEELYKKDAWHTDAMFPDSTELRDAVQSFWGGVATVPAGKLYSEYRMLIERSKS